MSSAAHRWSAWAGGPRGLLALLVVQVLMAVVWLFEPLAAFGLVLAVVAVAVVVRNPLWGVALLVVSRLVSTGALVFLRVGKVGLGPFELVLVACTISLAARAIWKNQKLWLDWPWKWPFLLFSAWVVLSLSWSVDKGDGLADVLPLILIFANTTLILAFVRTWAHVRFMLAVWLAACVFIGLAAAATDSASITVGVAFEAASGGGRETGLGQQPNWFAMNLFFVIPAALAMGATERGWQRLGWLLGAGFVTVTMLQAGSRGGAYATLIGVGLVAAFHPRFRRWAVGVGLGLAVTLGVAFGLNLGGLGQSLGRIGQGLALSQNYRPWNWQTCVEMFMDTGGRGIGAGGYETLLPSYNYLLSQSLYDYPHGIFWELIAHYGAPGLLLFGALILVVLRMSARTIRLSAGHPAQALAWAMPAAMLGYAAWSFVEFTVAEKPFWEFLALYTALGAALTRAAHPPSDPAPATP